MSQLHLPARHTDEDLAVAGSLAQLLHSGELYVAWSTDGGPAKPVVPATVNAVERPDSPVVHADAPVAPPALELPAVTIETGPPRRPGLLARLRARRRR